MLQQKLPNHLKSLGESLEGSRLSGGNADERGWELVMSTLALPKQIRVNDIDLTYTEQGRGELVILVHGDLGDYRTWNQQADTLSKKYYVISYSRRYHQPTSTSNGGDDHTYRRHVNDLISLIHTLGLGPAHLVGHPMALLSPC